MLGSRSHTRPGSGLSLSAGTWFTAIMLCVASTGVVLWTLQSQSDRMGDGVARLEALSQAQGRRVEAALAEAKAARAEAASAATGLQALKMSVRSELRALATTMREVQSSFEALSEGRQAKQAMDRVRGAVDKSIADLARGLVSPPLRTPHLPCLLTHTSTTPSVRICTLDPRVDAARSKLLHDDGALTVSRSWPLEQLLKGRRGALVVDAGAGIGYFSLLAAALGARVVAFEEDEDMVDLVRASADLNAGAFATAPDVKRGALAARPGGGVAAAGRSGSSSSSSSSNGVVVGSGGGRVVVPEVQLDAQFAGAEGDVYILHLAQPGRALEALKGAAQLLSAQRVAFLFIEFSPTKLRATAAAAAGGGGLQNGAALAEGDAPMALLQTLDGAGYNVFDDAHAQDGALSPKDFQQFVDGATGGADLTLFAARTNRKYDS